MDVQYSKTKLDRHNDLYVFEDNWALVDRFTLLERNYMQSPTTGMTRYDVATADQAALWNNDRTHTQREDITKRVNLDYEIPYAFGDKVSGYIKVGGSYSVKDRSNDVYEYQSYYGKGGTGGSRADVVFGMYPDFYHYTEPDYKPGKTMPGINFVDPDYQYGDVLNGISGIDLGWSGDLDFLKEVHDYFGVDEEGNPKFSDWQTYDQGIESNENDYTNREEYMAGYAMMEILIGKRIMLLPGVRYEQINTMYTANYVVENSIDPSGMASGYPQEIIVDDRENQNWFPQFEYEI